MLQKTNNVKHAMTRRKTSTAAILLGIIVLLANQSAASGKNADTTGTSDEKNVRVVIKIGHRMYPDFSETIETTMGPRHQISDTDFFFEATEFYPHFAIVTKDSINTIVSLSEEPKNVAVKIVVFKDDEQIEETWAVYKVKIPHYHRTSFLKFEIAGFEYAGQIYGNGLGETESR